MRRYRYSDSIELDDLKLEFYAEEYLEKDNPFADSILQEEEQNLENNLEESHIFHEGDIALAESSSRENYFCMSLIFQTSFNQLFMTNPNFKEYIKPETRYRSSNLKQFYNGTERKFIFLLEKAQGIYFPLEVNIYSRRETSLDNLSEMVLNTYNTEVKNEIPQPPEFEVIDRVIEVFNLDKLRTHPIQRKLY